MMLAPEHAEDLQPRGPGLSAGGLSDQPQPEQLGGFYQRMCARIGPKAAIVATAHKIPPIVYYLLTYRTPYRDLSAEEYDRRARQRDLANLRKRAVKLGLTLVESST